jgi:hypothetical protein
MFSSVLSPRADLPGRVRNESSFALRIAERRTQGNQRTDLDRPCFAFFNLGDEALNSKVFPLSSWVGVIARPFTMRNVARSQRAG